MKAKVEEQAERVLALIAKTSDAAKLREYALVLESLVMTYTRLQS